MAATPGAPRIEYYLFADNGNVPNNPRLPLIVYRGALETGGDAAASCMALFDRMVGPAPGRTGSIRIITTTAARMRCSASPPVGSA
jgi:hypothetical protein